MATQTKKAPVAENPETEPPKEVPQPVEVKAATPAPASVAPSGYVTLNEDELKRVNTVKAKVDDLIAYLEVLRDSQHSSEVLRAFSVAITEAETAGMWAVKAITHRG
jgi:hypothetical protein